MAIRNRSLVKLPALAVPATCFLAAGLSGCSSGPSALSPASIDADAAASQAMSLYDKDGDGAIAGAELDTAPELKSSMSTVDADKDGKVTSAEIAARINAWQESKVAITSLRCVFTINKKPLDGATVTFVPAPFLGDAIQPATATTTSDGLARPSVAKELRPTPDAPPGIAPGFYRVEVTKDGADLPAKFNKETTLGMEVSMQNPDMMNNRVRFEME
jgi:hypothetical protein